MLFSIKTLAFALFLLLISGSLQAQQLTKTVDRFTGDTTISTGFDTLLFANKSSIADRVVGVKNIHKGESKYWLFFYFSTLDATENNVKISHKNFAYFILNNDEYLRFPYSGRAGNYSAKDNAGFFIDVTNAIGRLQSSNIKIIRFETSTLYHEMILPDDKKQAIGDIINKLID